MSQTLETPLDPPPRRAGLRRGIKNVRRAYRMVFALVILVFGGWAILDGFRWYDIVFRTQIAEGKVLKKQTIAHPAGHEFRLEYSFNAGDANYVHETGVPLSIYDKAAEGQSIAVVYLPENPRLDHWLIDNTAARSHVMFLTIGHGLAALIAIIILRVMERPLARELRLARRGNVAQGQILTIGKPRGRRGIVRITYSFRTAAGAVVEGARNLPRRFPAHTLESGMAIEVLYDANNQRLHKPRLALDHIEFGDAGKKKS